MNIILFQTKIIFSIQYIFLNIFEVFQKIWKPPDLQREWSEPKYHNRVAENYIRKHENDFSNV